ncbi:MULTISPECIES: acyltransferase family protein [Flavobacterium]|uniref:acyltransferase family protein n=1 Tax=Flavobacterium TaxID=237 RepID=UPI001FCB828D|nr:MULTISPECIES: acyltransferase [Flavobacterium]UOK43759.1 acyltransferase [Flavobacterium enshiense]
MPTQTKKDNNYLDVLQVCRGIAALLVVLHHSVGSFRYYHGIDHPVLNFAGAFGKLGVDFFFVLSGFIITYSASFRYNQPEAFQKYLRGRLLRIYIPYLPIGIAMVLLYRLFPEFSNSGRDISLFTSLTLIPYGNPALSVAWTLLFELAFYLFFSITFFYQKIWNSFVVLWVTAILFAIAAFVSETTAPAFLKVFLSPYNLEFILGFLLAKLVLGDVKVPVGFIFGFVLFAFGLFCYVFYSKCFGDNFSINFIFSVFVFGLLYLLISRFNFALSRKNLFMLIGNATYSVYLIHNPLQMLVLRLWPKISNGFQFALALIFTLSLCCSLGYLYFVIFEKHVSRIVKSVIANRKKRQKIWTS